MKPIENERFFDLAAGHYCGLIVDEKAMKKIMKLNGKYNTELKALLYSLKENIQPSNWSMATSEYDSVGAVYCKYKDENTKVEDRIALFKLPQPELIKNYLGEVSRDVATRWCERKIREGEKEQK